MSLEDLGNIGEFVAAVAVLVTLGYLAIQIRQNTQSVRASTYQSMVQGQRLQPLVIEHREIAELFVQAGQDPSRLDEADQLRLYFALNLAFRSFDLYHYQYRKGLLEEEQWSGYDNLIRSFIGTSPAVSPWWNDGARQQYSESFRRYFDELLEDTGPDETTA